MWSQDYFDNSDAIGGYGDYQLEKDSIEKTASRRLKKIKAVKKDSKNLLEVGAAYGFFKIWLVNHMT